MIFPALNCRISTNISEYSSITQFKLNVETRSFTAWRNSRGNINPFTTFKPLGWKCFKTIGSDVSCVFIEIWSTWEVWRAHKKLEVLSATPRATLTHLSCPPNFPRASYLDERTLTYEPIVNFHKYATPWQLCYNRDKENLFHFTCSWKTKT